MLVNIHQASTRYFLAFCLDAAPTFQAVGFLSAQAIELIFFPFLLDLTGDFFDLQFFSYLHLNCCWKDPRFSIHFRVIEFGSPQVYVNEDLKEEE